MSDDYDLMAEMDEARDASNEANGRKTAVPIAAFYRTLKESGMDQFTAQAVTVLYTKRILFVTKEHQS